MKIIVAHPAMDFDALASMLAAKRIYEDAHMVTLGKANHNVQDFMALHSEAINIQNYLNKDAVDTVIMVDTRSRKRLQEYGSVLENEGVRVIIYDHHHPGDSEIEEAEMHYAPVGANVTQLVEMIEEREINISGQDATVMALGIYEDTGSLSYSNTTPRDLRAAAFLLERGANLSIVANYIDRPMSDDQQNLMNDLLANGKIETINGLEIFFATAQTKDFVGELAHLTAKLRDLHTVAAVFSIVAMGNRIYIVARGNSDRINVLEALRAYRGSGFEKAASAVIKDSAVEPEAVREEIIAYLKETAAPVRHVRDIMSSPVKTIDANKTIHEVNEFFVRYGHSGYPVIKDGKLAGIISRRDVEKAMYHKLGHVPVKGYMSHQVISIAPDASVEEAHDLMVKKNIGRLPVLEDGEIVGIISRSDLLTLMYGELPQQWGREERLRIETLLPHMRRSLPKAVFDFLGEIALLADREGYTVFLVGGFVRDILLGMHSDDLDLVVEGDGIAFAQELALAFHGQCTVYERFGTAHLRLENHMQVDVASARTEYYEYPAALPQVEYGTLRQDLYRRDFTINAMAISLNYKTLGRLVDFYGGKEDVDSRILRILHNLSFVEDPTRILRALRFTVRFDFHMEEETDQFAKKAVEDKAFEALSYRRIWHEVSLALRENEPYRILSLYNEYGIWPYIFPNTPFDEAWEDEFREVKNYVDLFKVMKTKPDLSLVYFLMLLYDASREELDQFFEKIDGRRRYKDAAYGLTRIKDFVRNGYYLNPVQWFYLRDVLMVEQLIVVFLKSDQERRDNLLRNAAAYAKIHIYSSRGDYKKIAGFDRHMVRPIVEDLAEQKLLGNLESKEQEIAYVEQNIKDGKYNESSASMI